MDPLFTVWLSAVYHNTNGWMQLVRTQKKASSHSFYSTRDTHNGYREKSSGRPTGSKFEQNEPWTETLSSASSQAELAAQ
jgi:hypothetical protein